MMKKRLGTLLVALVVAPTFLVGCGASSDLPAEEDAQLRNDFSRPLNEEELAQMGASGEAAPAPNKGE